MRLRKRQRMAVLVLALIGIGTATALTLTAFEDNLVFFHAPTDVIAKAVPAERRFRLGGLVEEGSVQRQADGVTVTFRVTDTVTSLPVRYTGVLPDLFREGQGVVAEGSLREGVFVAREVLARHDENYMPKEVADALKAAGQFKPEPPALPRERP
ncbi:MAG: cytochrome c maturation protein CcmE [Alphaproteobacteria bacterium]|nr:MAG: cytochrome c maturation protein CcmE [Alphaproteobacteria bacterium]